MRNLVATQKDFECFIPFNRISSNVRLVVTCLITLFVLLLKLQVYLLFSLLQVIEWSSTKATLNQQLASEQTIWSLPPSFAVQSRSRLFDITYIVLWSANYYFKISFVVQTDRRKRKHDIVKPEGQIQILDAYYPLYQICQMQILN